MDSATDRIAHPDPHHPPVSLADRVRTYRRLPTPSRARAIRVEAGVSRAALAGELGVCEATVMRWELGRRTPSWPMAWSYVCLLEELEEAVR